MFYYRVVIPYFGEYWYSSLEDISKGSLVLVDFHNRYVYGVVMEKQLHRPIGDYDIKNIIEVKEEIPENLIELARWVSFHYVADFDVTVKLLFPPATFIGETLEVKLNSQKCDKKILKKLKKIEKEVVEYLSEKKRWVKAKTIVRIFGDEKIYSILRNLENKNILLTRKKLPDLKEKEIVLDEIFSMDIDLKFERRITFKDDIFKNQGQTYFHIDVSERERLEIIDYIVAKNIELGKSVLILVPTIGCIYRYGLFLFKRYKDDFCFYHYKMEEKEKRFIWRRALLGQKKIFLATKFGIFLPVKNLGAVIIVDEEDELYKEKSRKPFYNAKEVAFERQKIDKFNLFLLSFSPSIDIYYKFKRGEIKELEIESPYHFTGRVVKILELGDIRKPVSYDLLKAIRRSVKEGKKSVIFYNRRGYSTYIHCLDCESVLKCSSCDVPFVYYKDLDLLICPVCGKRKEMPDRCPYCGGDALVAGGYGVERIGEILKRYLPGTSVNIIEMSPFGDYSFEMLFKDFMSSENGIWIGTEILIKGVNLGKGVGMVGVIIPDFYFNLPYYGIYERVFHLIVNILKRSYSKVPIYIQVGVGGKEFIRKIVSIDYEGFYKEELEKRRSGNYPPYVEVIIVEGRGEEGEEVFRKLSAFILKIKEFDKDIEIFGPARPLYYKIKNFYRWFIFTKVSPQKSADFKKFLREFKDEFIIIVNPIAYV